ncbi:MAG: ABC transporter substrate binding protein [Sterolibacterium sp.]
MTSNREERSRCLASLRHTGSLSRFAAALAVLLALAMLLALAPAVARAGSPVHGRDNVLVLHSYSPDYVWTRSQQDGVDTVFGPLAATYDVRIEYLDAVHHPELLKAPLVLELLRTKLADQRFRVVLTSDNAAFDFARAHRAELFPGVPIVFMGLNGYADSMRRGETGITGVAEDPDMLGTLQVLQQLVPETKRIVFPGMAEDLTYPANRATALKALAAFPAQVATEFPEYPDVDAALDALRTLPPDSAIIVMANMRTRDGEGISSQRVVELVSAAAPVPVFTNWDFAVGQGAVGGSVISGVEQGRLAAEIAVRILRGERPESIPVHRGAGKTFLFDHRQLARFGIPASRLPPGAMVLFAPERTLRISRDAAWIAAVSFAVLLGVSTSLILSVRRRRRAEEQVRALNQELEERVRERTAQLEAANKELEAFSSSVSHDLRAPLRAIDGFSHLLTEEYGSRFDEEGRRYLDLISRNAVRMGDLISDLLEFSRMSRREIALASVDMTALAREVFEEVRGAASERNIVLSLGDLPPARGDEAMIRQVLVNLLANAVKFTAQQTEAVVEVTGVTDGNENIYGVKDNGVGFDMQYADKLFCVFQRLHAANEFRGTGIGLAIVKRIVERHGGRVWAEGKAGDGATFYFSLPPAAASGGAPLSD